MPLSDSFNKRVRVLTCPQCGAQVPSGHTSCAYCGAQLVLPNDTNAESGPAMKTKFCKYCGKKIPEDAVICTACGRQVEELRTQPAPAPAAAVNNQYNVRQTVNLNAVRPDLFKDKWVAIILCLLFGTFGVHKFYEKKYLMGFLYLFTFGLLTIGVVVDLVILIFKPRHYIP